MNKLIIRVMDGDPSAEAHGQMLGWKETRGEARGDGHLWIPDAVQVPIERAGTTRYVSVHWADFNVEVRLAAPQPQPVVVGQVLTVWPQAQPIIRVGPQAGGLPPITTRGPVSVVVLAGETSLVGTS